MNTYATTLVFTLLFFLLIGCTKETVEPRFTGSIEGQVQNSSTGEGIAFAGITTNPGTDAILTDQEGQFTISDIPTGNYTIQAEKENFSPRTIRVSVTEDRAAVAQILLSGNDEGSSNGLLSAEVINFFNTSRNDSMFVDVEFRVENISSATSLNSYEVYFQIYTNGNSFFQEFKGDSLGPGEQTISEFTRFIRQFSADSVAVSGTFTSGS